MRQHIIMVTERGETNKMSHMTVLAYYLEINSKPQDR